MRKSALLSTAILLPSLLTPWCCDTTFAKENCVAEPKASAGHWYYHVDPATHRKCWYLDHNSGQSQISPKLKREASAGARLPLPKADRELLFRQFARWQEQQNRSTPSAEQTNRDALFNEFVLWEALHAER